MWKNFLRINSVLFVLLLILVLMMPVFSPVLAQSVEYAPKVVAFRGEYLLTHKAVLSYLFMTKDAKIERDIKNLQVSLGLADSEMTALRNIALNEAKALMGLKEKSLKAISYNKQVEEIGMNTLTLTRHVLGKKHDKFLKWIEEWWLQEAKYRNNIMIMNQRVKASVDRIYVYATQYYGHTSFEVALPDKYVKFANLGWWHPSAYNNPPYTVNVWNPDTNKAVLGVEVREVGPWNENDNYWDSAYGSNHRRKFRDLSLGTPESYAAYYRDYNGGKDEFGRSVTNPAGIDLTPDVAKQLGLRPLQNAWVWVRYSDLP